jgi:membrane fusion protein (multidrug efflux system)
MSDEIPVVANQAEASTPAADAIVARPRRRQTWLWIAGPALVLAIGAYLYVTGGRYVDTDNAYVQADRVTIAPQVAGRVVEVLVKENQAVEAGELLFRIDPEPLEIAVARAEAELGAIGDVFHGARNQYDSAAADLRSSEAALRFNEQQFERQKELRAKGLVSQMALDNAANELASARGKRDSNAALLAKAKSVLGGAVNTPMAQLSGYQMAKAELDKAQLDLAHAEVRAPAAGVIGKQHLQPGDFLAVGQAAMPLVASGALWVDANFKETDLTHVAIGQAATIEVDTYPGRHWRAHVASISPASGSEFSLLPAQNATGNWVKIVQRIPVRLALDRVAAGPTLRAGMSADVEIDTGAQNSVIGRLLGAREGDAKVAANN